MSTSILQHEIPSAPPRRNARSERGHRVRVFLAAAASFLLLSAIAVYGAGYYLLPMSERPYSDKYALLRPSGTIGLKLGILGTALFFIIFLYALRKVIPWLGRMGTARHWMDFHVIAGASAPIVIAFHASFKFQGLAGIAFWIMLAVALSGVVGRYLYAQIPRSLSAAELSMAELQNNEGELAAALVGQSLFSAAQLNCALRVPTAEHIRRIGALPALLEMLLLDLGKPFRVARLRRIPSSFGAKLRSLGGLLSTGNAEIESIVNLVRQKAALSKRIAFLEQTRKVFHLWHVVHRPFSYAFAVLAIVHIVVVMGLGFGGMGLR
jgi:hypothetical protein